MPPGINVRAHTRLKRAGDILKKRKGNKIRKYLDAGLFIGSVTQRVKINRGVQLLKANQTMILKRLTRRCLI